MDEIIFESEKQRRIAIPCMLNNALTQLPKHIWKIAGDCIEDALEKPKQKCTSLCHLFEYLTHDCTNDFSGKRKKLKERNNEDMIPINSTEDQIVADYIEGEGLID